MPNKLLEYVEARTQRSEVPGECWLWKLSVGGHGYGQACWDRRVTIAHRLSWRAYRGEIPEGMTVDHLCYVRRCVNPEHLELVTRSVNSARAYEHSRTGLCKQGLHETASGRCMPCRRASRNASYARNKKRAQPNP